VLTAYKTARQPLFWAAMAFSGGIWIGVRAWRPASWWITTILLFSLATLWFVRRRSWMARALSLGIWITLGALLVQVRGTPSTSDPRIFEFADGSEVTITGHVTREGYPRAEGTRSIREPIDLETETIENDGKVRQVRAGVRLTIYEKVDPASHSAAADESDARSHMLFHSDVPPAEAVMFRYGTRLRIRAKLHPPRIFRNPGAFDYEGYLRDNGIAVLGSARAENIEALPGFSGSPIELWRTRLHASIVRKIHTLWPERQAALVDAMMLGEDAFLRSATRAEFQRSGTYHILVVSGMNLSILAFVIFWMLRQFRLDPALAGVVTVVVSFAYAFLTDVGPPVWRAAFMLAIYLGARLLYRDRSMLNAIGAAALGVLVADPRSLLGASFQLTFLSVLLIAGIGIPLLERTSQPYSRGLRLLRASSYDLHVEPRVAQFRLDLRLIAGRLARFLGLRAGLAVPSTILRVTIAAFELILISILMQIGLTVPMAFYFHRATAMGMPANLVVVPLTEVLMPATAAAVGLGYLSTALAWPAAWVSGVTLDFITGTVRRLGGSTLADLRVAIPSTTLILAAMATIAFAMIAVRLRRVAVVFALVSMTAVAAWIAFLPPHPQLRAGALEITSIDVGQGDSTLVTTPQGRTVLVDAGGLPLWMHSEFDIGEQVVSPYLWTRGLSHLDVIVITHPHADHLGGMPSVITNFRPRELWLSTDAAIRRAGTHPHAGQARRHVDQGLARRRRYRLRRRALPRTRSRTRNRLERRANDDSLVMTVAYGKTSALLEADTEPATERRIVEERPKAALLKVAHHGSGRVTSSELLATLHPRYASISVGARNVYGHPRREVLDRLQNAAVKTYRTDMTGAVSFYLDGNSVTPEVALSR